MWGLLNLTFCNKKVFYVHLYAFLLDGTDVVDCVADPQFMFCRQKNDALVADFFSISWLIDWMIDIDTDWFILLSPTSHEPFYSQCFNVMTW